ncbi:MAG: exodeoxyribonuclease VII small subunit [Gammaproteobacteria bacterium]|nr:exodeoxyribonuclease VII small subunit [Gammaproteobacteria bacterium]MCP5196704.1 exodeoxyribonuclease VII small subunit [Gammaproteobacteria bacterium]
MTAKKSPPIPFEVALAELENLVKHLEQGDLSLEETLQCFKQGVSLVKNCQVTLQHVERQVEQVMERHGQLETLPFVEAVD